ncbi:MAG: GntR family transcriptional regulator [Proteobacteria bacterium]|nr:GntR family transcriptional regulator [Pseudomonadota bacterium]MBU4606873.1 GntR family transcriptional regulator [Pseudomonadota bacterium]MCG2764982.1 GntR family transcriptional regulator [Desulfarculaceae bacterium]
MPKLPREKLSNLAYQALKEMISNHRFQPGTRLNVESLAKEMGVSRTPVWEAVGRLEQEGLVKNIPNRGVFMDELTPQQALQLYEVREMLEGMAARLAAGNITPSGLKRMERNLENQERVVADGDLVGYSQLDFEFHAIVYEACGNPYLQELLETIKNKMRPLTTHLAPILPDLYDDHAKLLAALKAGDPEQAETAFRSHNQLMRGHIMQESRSGEWPPLKEASR